MSWHHAGALLRDTIGAVAVDPARQNAGGGATRVNGDDEGALPLYRRWYRCPTVSLATGSRKRGCGELYQGLSFRPQYDDEQPEHRLCDRCVNAYEHRGQTDMLAGVSS